MKLDHATTIIRIGGSGAVEAIRAEVVSDRRISQPSQLEVQITKVDFRMPKFVSDARKQFELSRLKT